jgi:hypothetical protein
MMRFLFLLFAALPSFARTGQTVTLVFPDHPRVRFGVGKVQEALMTAGYHIVPSRGKARIVVTFKALSADSAGRPGKEGFFLERKSGKDLVIRGGDASGALYGCLELAARIRESGKIPETLLVKDQPEMVLRGTCIGLQKTTYLPGRGVYEYPYTPETFPWFYDKDLWIKYLDMLVENRYNSLYLWNGHPFASLVRVKDYPYAVEVDDATFRKNEEMYRFLTTEADKRGIWVIQMFYNIIVSKPFAERHGIVTQDRNRPIVPLIADYTRKSIAAFVEKYPNVGLLVTLGEAMEGVGQDDVDWFTKTIIPGVQDGLKALGKKDLPPIVLRGHDTDAPRVMKAALPLYKNLYTEAKYNGEALTTYTPRGKWADLHRTLSRIGTVHVENVHILANLEPFRYGSPDFICKSVQAMHRVYEANALHLYPQASFWDWPWSADKAPQRMLQLERDWLWYRIWARYAWRADRSAAGENQYWSDVLAARFGLTREQGASVLEALEESGEISPKLLRRYGITDGNRQTLTLGMLMTQLINPQRYGLFTLLYESEAPEGEMIIEYAEKDWKSQPHRGETPVRVADEVIRHGEKAVAAIERVAGKVTRNRDEFARLRNDMHCYDALARTYAFKARAALEILRYRYSNQTADLKKALPLLEKSVQYFDELAGYTKDAYLYANSMQTAQRKIPMRGVDGTFKTWEEMRPVYRRELDTFRRRLDSLEARPAIDEAAVKPWKPADVTLTAGEWYATDQPVFSDTTLTIHTRVPELGALKGIRTSWKNRYTAPNTLTFTCKEPVRLLVGYFSEKQPGFLPVPELETDANANQYGQADIKILQGAEIAGLPPVNVHAFSFSSGTHTLRLGKGACLLLGFVSGNEDLRTREIRTNVDWLFD